MWEGGKYGASFGWQAWSRGKTSCQVVDIEQAEVEGWQDARQTQGQMSLVTGQFSRCEGR